MVDIYNLFTNIIYIIYIIIIGFTLLFFYVKWYKSSAQSIQSTQNSMFTQKKVFLPIKNGNNNFSQPDFNQPNFSQPIFNQPNFSQPMFNQPSFQTTDINFENIKVQNNSFKKEDIKIQRRNFEPPKNKNCTSCKFVPKENTNNFQSSEWLKKKNSN